MFRQILVPVDGSHTSDKAIEKAASIASAFSARITVVCVIDTYAFTGVGNDMAYGQAEYLSSATAEAHQATRAASAIFRQSGVDTALAVVEGQAVYRSILDTAAGCDADLIVMGSHGRKGLTKLVLGSVASQVLSHTHLPVLIVRE
ncbi:MAG: universal stress protein [Polaromonas sp.]|nr:universal stress protein [Polaromonas sp.]